MPVSRTELFRATFPKFAFFAYVAELRRTVQDCHSVLDVGCGDNSPLAMLGVEHTVGFDAYAPTLGLARAQQTHSEYVLGAVRALSDLFPAKHFDGVIALDLIEHLTPEEGQKLVVDMELLARKRIVLFTPNGFIEQESHDGDLQAHHSGWTAADLQAMGLDVIGMLGYKALRGERHTHRIRPAALGGTVSVLSHYLYTRAHPQQAAALFCTKQASEPPG